MTMDERTPAIERTLPKRDYWLLPLIAVATLVFMAVGAEVLARVIWPENMMLTCLHRDADGEEIGRPNCESLNKAAEGPWVTNQFNECGLRATGPCRGFDQRRPRIVVLGSSTSWGYMVPFEQTWSTRLANDLSQRCSSERFDVQAFPGFGDINGNAHRIDDALALHPDMVIMVISPLDLEQINARGFVPPSAGGGQAAEVEDAPESLLGWLRDFVSESRASTIAQHFLYRNPEIYIPAFLTNGDKADFLREPLSPAWRNRVAATGEALRYYNQRFEARGVPMMVIYAPQQAQAQLASEDELSPPNVDPTELPEALDNEAEAAGVLFADATQEFEQIRNPEDMYYNADGHLNGEGHELLAEAAEQTLTESYGPAPLCPHASAERAAL
jgi:lysophospholipase L1-like esterase